MKKFVWSHVNRYVGMIACRKEALAVLAQGRNFPLDRQVLAVKWLQSNEPIESQADILRWAKQNEHRSFADLTSIIGQSAGWPAQLGVASEVFVSLREQVGGDLSNTDIVKLVVACGKSGVYDSELFKVLDANLKLTTEWECMQLVKAMNRLQIKFFEAQIFDCIAENDWPVWIPVCEFFLRVSHEKYLNTVVEKFSQEVKRRISQLSKDEHLLRLKSMSIGEAMEIVFIFVKFKKALGYSNHQESEIKFLLDKVIGYEIRNLSDLGILVKLLLSLSELEVFDDFFIRRRLLPSIFHTYKALPKKTAKDMAGALVVLKQVPFSCAMTREFLDLVKKDFEFCVPDTNNKFYIFCKEECL